jgi:hypothetical protein
MNNAGGAGGVPPNQPNNYSHLEVVSRIAHFYERIRSRNWYPLFERMVIRDYLSRRREGQRMENPDSTTNP